MHDVKRVAKNTGFLYIRMALTVFISLYSTRLILNALGAGDFGIFSVIAGTIAMLTFLNTAMAAATQRFMSYAEGAGDKKRLKSIFNVSVILHLIIGVLVVLLLEGISYFLFDGVLKIDTNRLLAAKAIYHFMVVSTFFTIISVPYDAVINAHENMLLVAILGVIEAFLKLGIAILITQISTDKLIVYGLLMAVLAVLLLIIRGIYCHRKYDEVRIHIRKYYNKPLFKEMTGFAGWSFLGSSSSMISNYGQGIVLNIFFGTLVNAAQGIANQVNGQISAFARVLLQALNPIIAKSEGAGNRELMLKAAMLGSKVSFFLLMFFYIPVLIEMPIIFKFWLKSVPDYCIIFTRLLLIRVLIEQLFLTLSSSISAVGNIKNYQIYSSILNILAILFSYFMFLLDFSPSTIYIVFIFYSLISAAITLYYANKYCNLSITSFFKNVIIRTSGAFLFAVAFSSIPFFLMNEGVIRLLIVFLFSTVSSLIVIWYFGFLNEERLKIFKVFKHLSIKKQSIDSLNEFEN